MSSLIRLLSCQPRVTVTSYYFTKLSGIYNRSAIDIYRFALAQVECTCYCFTYKCKQTIMSLSLLAGRTVPSTKLLVQIPEQCCSFKLHVCTKKAMKPVT